MRVKIYMFRIFIDMFLIKAVWSIFKIDYEYDKTLPSVFISYETLDVNHSISFYFIYL